MGQKVHPKSFRLAINKSWDSIAYYSKSNYATYVFQDCMIRNYVLKVFKKFLVASVVVRRSVRNLVLSISVVKAGFIINKHKEMLDQVRNFSVKLSGCSVEIDLIEFRKPDLSAKLIAENISIQLEKRVSFRRAMKKAIGNVLRAGAKGVKVRCSGRLSGAEIARSEWYLEGKMPLHTLQANIDYYANNAHTIYGIIGVKVWICI